MTWRDWPQMGELVDYVMPDGACEPVIVAWSDYAGTIDTILRDTGESEHRGPPEARLGVAYSAARTPGTWHRMHEQEEDRAHD